MRLFPAFAAGLLAIATQAGAMEPVRPTVSIPIPDPVRGKMLFATKGCVVCHSVNGVGGTYAPKLDSEESEPIIRPLAFAARMWRGAEAMLALQAMEFGYQISLSEADIADLAAFASDPELQRKFSDSDIPDVMRGWSINQVEELGAEEKPEEGEAAPTKKE